jgi:hypothetical protein
MIEFLCDVPSSTARDHDEVIGFFSKSTAQRPALDGSPNIILDLITGVATYSGPRSHRMLFGGSKRFLAVSPSVRLLARKIGSVELRSDD